MPELPEVETVRLALADATTGRVIERAATSNKRMRRHWPRGFAAALADMRVMGWRRRGKYLLGDLAGVKGDRVLLLHLGMSGAVRFHHEESAPPRKPHDHLAIGFRANPAPLYMILHDPRRFGGGDLFAAEAEATHPLLAKLGIEPLGNGLRGDFLTDALKGKTCSIKAALLDQRIIAGIGNIYASEALFAAGIAPHRKAGLLKADEAAGLADAIRDVLARAIAAGGTSLRDHIRPDGDIGYFALDLNVYGRAGEDCLRCKKGKIRLLHQTGRASFYCPACQH